MPAATIPTFTDVDVLPTEMLWTSPTVGPRIPKGCVTIIYGEGSVGKGRMIWESLIGPITTGRPLPFCTEPTDVGSVVVVLPEDNLHEQQAARLEASGAEPSMVIPFTRLPGGARFKLSADQRHEGDAGQLRALVEKLRITCRACREQMADGRCPECGGTGSMNPQMVYIDPVAAVVGWGSIQTNAGARRLLEPLEDLAESTGVAVVLVAHPVTGGKLQGSMGLEQAARLIYRVYYDNANPHYRIVEMVKHNNLPKGEDLRFAVENDTSGAARVTWLDGAEIDRRSREWRKPSYTAAVSIQRPSSAQREIRQIGTGFTSLREAQYACSADEAAPGGFIPDWTHHDARTVVASIARNDGTVMSFAIARKGGLEAVPATIKATA